jgi:hypothetical protein
MASDVEAFVRNRNGCMIAPHFTVLSDLAVLWSEFLAMLEHYGTDDPDEADPVVGKIILEFAKIDPGSYSYRYPVDRQGNPVPVAYSDLHLPTLANVMQGVAGYFTGCDGYLGSLLAASPY